MDANASIPKEVKSVRIPEQKTFDGIPFPLVLSPADGFKGKDATFWKNWVVDNLDTVQAIFLKYGSILFRDFAFDTPKEFDDFAKGFGYKDFPYLGGLAVRTHIVGNVYTSVEQPIGVPIPFHHEMAHVRDYPHILFFYADLPSKEGGETPILPSNVIYRKMAELEPELVGRMEKESLRYVRVAPDENDLMAHCGRSWKSTFRVETKEEAEKKAKAAGYDFEWLNDGSMKTITNELPPIRIDKRTGKKMWFNTIYGAATAWIDARNDGSKAVIFPNGDTIPPTCVAHLEKVTEEASVSFGWKRKDVLIIDNRTVQHSRATHFVPPRRILASLYTDHHGPLSFLS